MSATSITVSVVPFYQKVDTTQQFRLGLRRKDYAGNEYVYLQGVASVARGTWVVYDEAFVTTRLVANGKGQVAIAQAAVSATTSFGWFMIYGSCYGLCLSGYADNAKVWATATDGSVDDADVATDLISGAIGRSNRATTGDNSGMALFQLVYPMALNEVYN